MRALLFWFVVAAAIVGLSWWRHPQEGDGGARTRWEVLQRMLPSLAGLMLTGVSAGLFARERVRYASPSLAWLAKRAAAGGAALAAVYVFAPLDWAPWTPWAAGFISAAGTVFYTANLPTRL